jgi:3-methylfumaryl-CoA hydratase
LEIAPLQRRVGKIETRQDQVTAAPVAALAATLDIDAPTPEPGDLLPPLWHWLYFLPLHKHSELGPDGHARLEGFPPRRMWAGGRLEFRRALRVGERITRTSTIVSVQQKEGRTGPLVFVLVRHEIAGADGIALTEEHDIVYRGWGESKVTPAAALVDADWERVIHPDDVLLFRYSALTFNGHRIHYDRRYATEVEGYPGLVVHGPLIATLLMDLLRRHLPDANVEKFSFRAVGPVFDTGDFCVCGKLEGERVRLWAKGAGGALAMTAAASLTL